MISGHESASSLAVQAYDRASLSLFNSLEGDHHHRFNALLRLEIRDLIHLAESTFQLVRNHDVGWHQAIFDESIAYHEGDQASLLELYRTWHGATGHLLRKLDEAAIPDLDVNFIQASYSEVTSLLRPDDEFFEGEELDDLAEKVLGELSQGETIEMKKLAD